MIGTSVLLQPKNGDGRLSVVAIGRISTPQQDSENIEASYRYLRDCLAKMFDGPMDIKQLGEQASGMLVDRATIREAEELVASGKVDLVIAEDLARIYRNPRYQYDFVQNAVDVGTRVICPGDNLDTGEDNWEVAMGAAALRHGLYIPDTRRRVRRTATHCFHNGGMVQKIRYGYRKLTADEADSGQFGPKGLRITKRTECTPIIVEMKNRVMRGEKYAAVAEWLEAEHVKPGPHVENGRWTARLVSDLLDDPILSGTRTFRDTIYQPIFKTGKHKPIKNTEPETSFHLELAHLSVKEHDALRNEIARRRNAHVSKTHCQEHRRGVPRRRSIWPGQAMTCAICGAPLHYMGKHLKCRNALPRSGRPCWNRVQVSAELARNRVLKWLADVLDRNQDERTVFVDALWELLQPSQTRSVRRKGDLDREIKLLEKKAANLAEAIAEGGHLKPLVQRLIAVERDLDKARRRRSAKYKPRKDESPFSSRQQVDAHMESVLQSLVDRSFEFADLMRRVFPEYVIQPVQSLDSGLVRPRARLTFCLNAISGSVSGSNAATPELPDRHATLDLFEPPLHVRHLQVCLNARQAHPNASLKQLAACLGVNHMVVKRAFDYARLMEREGLTELYRELDERPKDASRWRSGKTT